MINYSSRKAPTALFCLLLLASVSQTVHGQNEVPSVTRAFAIENATVAVSPGQILDSATVVVRNGIIESVGRSIAIPYDARVIRGDSLFVYAGFIDGLGHTGIPEPRANNASQGQNQGSTNRSNPTNERAGIQPERSAMDLLDNKDKSIADYRKAGVAIVHVVPRGRMLPGSGAIVGLGADLSASAIVPEASMFMQFSGARGVYPATPMGVMAKFRNLYRQSENEQAWTASYKTNPAGIRRPPNNPAHTAFGDVIDGDRPVVMLANNVLSTYRAMALQKELGFEMILAGLGQAAEMIEELNDSGAPILLTMKLPDAKDAEKDKKKAKADSTKSSDAKKKDKAPAPYNPDLRTRSYADVAAESANLEARKAETYRRYVEAAAALEKAGVPFGFSTADIKAKDFKTNLRKMIEVGLSENAALAALTTNPAKILGVEKAVGTVEKGKMANIVVSSGSYFAEKSFVQHMIVDGELFSYDAPEKKSTSSGGDEGDALAGTWRYLTSVDGVDYAGSFTVSNDGGSLSGTIQGDNLPRTDLTDLDLDGDSFSFGFSVPEIGPATMTGTLSGESASGTIMLPSLGSFPASLKRTSKPD